MNDYIKEEAKILYSSGWNQEDKREFINSYGVTSEVWEEFKQAFKGLEEEYILEELSDYLNDGIYNLKHEIADYLADYIYENEHFIDTSAILKDVDRSSGDTAYYEDVVYNLLKLIPAIATDGYYTIHDVIYSIDDAVLVNAFGEWFVCEIEYHLQEFYPESHIPTFKVNNELHYLRDFIKC